MSMTQPATTFADQIDHADRQCRCGAPATTWCRVLTCCADLCRDCSIDHHHMELAPPSRDMQGVDW